MVCRVAEAFAWQGAPSHADDPRRGSVACQCGVSDKLMADLASNSFTGSVFLAVAMGAISQAAISPAAPTKDVVKASEELAATVGRILDL